MQCEPSVVVVTPFATMVEFWEFLTRRTRIDPEILEEYRVEHRKMWRPLGATLIKLGILTWEEVTHLLRIQADEPHVRIGELAVREGLCRGEELDEAIRYHAIRHPHPFELLARDPRLDERVVFDALVGYARHLEGRVTRRTTPHD